MILDCCTIINIEKSPIKEKRYRLFLINGDHYDIGLKNYCYYIDDKDIIRREKAYIKLKSIKQSELLYEMFILNGYSQNVIKNINFFNKEILRNN